MADADLDKRAYASISVRRNRGSSGQPIGSWTGLPGPIGGACLLLAVCWLFFYKLSARDLWSSHEGRAAQNAQMMLEQSCWSMPTLYCGWADHQKPPLYYWLVAAVGWARGGQVDKFCVRVPAAAAALLGVLLLWWLGSFMFDPLTGRLSALVLATSLRYWWLARVGRIDMPLSVSVLAALALFWLAWQGLGQGARARSRRPRLVLAGCYTAMAIAVMFKGPVGIVLPLLAIGSFLCWQALAGHEAGRGALGSESGSSGGDGSDAGVPQKRAGFLARVVRMAGLAGLHWGWLLVAVVAGPWFLWAVLTEGGEFLRTFFLHHNVHRAFGLHGLEPEPFWYYVPGLIGVVFPWSVALVSALLFGWRRASAGDARYRFLLCWLGAMLLFLSLIRFKRLDYLLPLLPASSLLIAATATGYWRTARAWLWCRLHGWVALGIGLVVLMLAATGLVGSRLLNSSASGLPGLARLSSDLEFKLVVELVEARVVAAWLIAAVAAACAGSSWYLLRRIRPIAGVVLSAVAFGVLLTAYVVFVVPALEPSRSQRPFAELARRVCPAPGVIGFYGRENHQLVFYVGRPVRWLPTREDLYQMLASSEPAFVIADYKRLQESMREWSELDLTVVATNISEFNPTGKHEHPMALVTNRVGAELAAERLEECPSGPVADTGRRPRY